MQRTLVVTDGTIEFHYGRLPKTRVVWRARGIEFWVKGSLGGMRYEQAANLAMQECVSLHIPLISLRKVTK